MEADRMSDTRYSRTHEWCRLEGNVGTIGISKHAADELTDLTYLDLKVKKGDRLKQGQVFGEIDSVKATSELFAPVSGTVAEINGRFADEDELAAITRSPEDEGWMLKVELSTPRELDGLLSKADYDAFIEKEGGH
jgi:glycine cleavage system H protein